MVGFFLLVIVPLHYAASASTEEQSTCGIDGICAENEVCTCWGCVNIHDSPPPCPVPSCPLQKTVGETCYVRDENDIDTSRYGCTANCTYKKIQFDDEERFCFKRPGHLKVTNYACKYPQIVEHGETPGEDCNRDCTSNKKNNTCAFTFYIENLKSDYDGRRADGRVRNITTYNGVLPGPGIVVCEGDTVKLRLMNLIEGTYQQLKGHSNGTTIHMHGIRRWKESYEDGVPGVNQCELQSGKSFNYTMTAKIENHENAPAGTYWYHSHVGSQRTNGAGGKIIIMPRKKSTLYDIDNATNTLFLQEWYITEDKNIPVSVLVNGQGRVGPTINSIPKNISLKNITWDEHVGKYNLGYKVEFEKVPYPDYNPDITHYAKFDVKPDLRYRFRIIGGISQNFPLLVSIEDHNFTAIATDSIDFKKVENLKGLWIAAGERYDIVIHTKKSPRPKPYKIKIYGNSAKNSPLCTVAWLKYPGQKIDQSYTPDSDCTGFDEKDLDKIINPVRSKYTRSDDPKYVFLNDLKATWQQPNIKLNLDTYYVDFSNLAFNNLSMTYDDIPFLYQSPAKPTCGPNCSINYKEEIAPNVPNITCDNTIKNLELFNCTSGDTCQCPHVNHQPHVPGPDGKNWWFETILINPFNGRMEASHPIHQHGGWYVLLAEKQFPFSMTITRDLIIEMDNNCTQGKHCLNRNFNLPIQKDTIQVPVNGYVIIRTPVDNAGTWIVHCHINHHVESGMAMVLQIGGLGDDVPASQHWSLGPFEDQKNVKCPQKLDTYRNPGRVEWFFRMKPVKACINPGNTITFNWLYGHNVNKLSKENWKNCQGFTNTTKEHGDKTIHFPDEGTFYFACGVLDGYHCKQGHMKAQVTVTNDTQKCLNGELEETPGDPGIVDPAGNTTDDRTIKWHFGMQVPPITKCIKPGNNITFLWKSGHNVNNLTKKNWKGCKKFENTSPENGPKTIQFPDEGIFYYACGVGDGFHCFKGHMKAKIIVTNDTQKCLNGELEETPEDPGIVDPAGNTTDDRSIKWHFGMPVKPITKCIKPGNNVTFVWNSGHNVNNLTKFNWETCTGFENTSSENGPKTIQFPDEGTFYYACGMGDGWHCVKGNMRAKIIVTNDSC